MRTNVLSIRPSLFVYIMIFLSPFGAYAVGLGGDADLSIMNIYMILVFPMLFLTVTLWKNRSLEISGVGISNLLYIFVAIAGCIMANNSMPALRGVGAYVLKDFLAFLFVVYYLDSREDVETAAKLFLIMGLVSVTMSFTQLISFFFFGKIVLPPFSEYFGGVTLKSFGFETGAFSIPGFARAQGFFNQGADQYPAFMLIPFAISIYFLIKQKYFTYYAIVFLFFLALLISVSRGALLGMFAGLMFSYVLFRFPNRTRSIRLFRVYAILMLLLAAIGFIYITKDADIYSRSSVVVDSNTIRKTPIYLLERLNPFLSGGKYEVSQSIFADHLELAFKHGFDNLGFGLGSQNFDNFVYNKYPVRAYSAHSNFIIFLGDNGIWGLLAQIMIILLTIFYGLKAYYRSPIGNPDHLPLFLTAAYVGMVCTGVVRTFYLMPHTFMVSGMIVKLWMVSKKRDTTV